MNCEEVQTYLSDFVDRSLGVERAEEIEDHLAGCDICRDEMASLAACRRLVSSLPAVEPPANFTAQVMAEIRETAPARSFWKVWFLPLQTKIPLQATALVLIAVLAVYVYQKQALREKPVVATTPAPSRRDATDKTKPSVARIPAIDSSTPRAAASPKNALPHEFRDAEESKEPAALPRLTAPKKDALEKSSPSAQAKETIVPASPPEKGSVSNTAPSAGKRLPSPRSRQDSAAASLNTRSSGAVIRPDYELAIRLKEVPRDEQATRFPSEFDRVQARQRSTISQEESKNLEQARLRAIETDEPQTVWLTIAGNEYEAVKEALAGMGNIEMESSALAHQNDTVFKSSDPLRIRATIFPPRPSGNAAPSRPPAR